LPLTARPGASAAEPLFRSREGFGAVTAGQATRIIQRIAAAAGLAGQGRWGPHSARKWFARAIYEASGHDILLTKAALGHAHVATTERYLSADQDRAAGLILGLAAPTTAGIAPVRRSA
jgi:integrase